MDFAARLEALEDKFEIVGLIMSYPLALDSGDADYCRKTWAKDGVFDRGQSEPAEHSGRYQGAYGVETIIAEMSGPAIGQARAHGLAHVMTAPVVSLAGDRAVATNYNQLYERHGDGFACTRVTANRWELVRTAGRWRILRRTLRLLDGSPEGPALLGQALTETTPGSPP